MWAGRGPYSIALVPAKSYVSKKALSVSINTYPDTLHVECSAIGGDALVVKGFENVVFSCLVREATTQPIDIGFEYVRSEEFMGESREREIEVISQSTIPEFRWLRDSVPNSLHIRGESNDKVLHRSGAKVIANDEKQEGLLMRPDYFHQLQSNRDEDKHAPVCGRLAK